jgi:hypothetical protein
VRPQRDSSVLRQARPGGTQCATSHGDLNEPLRTETARLSEVLGEEVFRVSGIGRTDDTEALRTRVGQLEQQVLDLRQELGDRTDDLDAARAANRDLISLAKPETQLRRRALSVHAGQL